MSLKHLFQGQSNLDDSNFKIDQVVLVKVPNKPRPFWHLGRIIELLPGTDQEVRVCKVKKSDSSEVVTSVENLFPLELSLDQSNPNVNNVVQSNLLQNGRESVNNSVVNIGSRK